jgi:hypothetical protein
LLGPRRQPVRKLAVSDEAIRTELRKLVLGLLNGLLDVLGLNALSGGLLNGRHGIVDGNEPAGLGGLIDQVAVEGLRILGGSASPLRNLGQRLESADDALVSSEGRKPTGLEAERLGGVGDGLVAGAGRPTSGPDAHPVGALPQCLGERLSSGIASGTAYCAAQPCLSNLRG